MNHTAKSAPAKGSRIGTTITMAMANATTNTILNPRHAHVATRLHHGRFARS